MRLKLFNKVIFEGTAQECEAYRKDMIDRLMKLDDELKDTYPMKATDTRATYYETLKVLNPFVYDTLTWYKDVLDDHFIEFIFDHMDLEGVKLYFYDYENPKRKRVCSFGFIFNTIVLELRKQYFWRIEE